MSRFLIALAVVLAILPLMACSGMVPAPPMRPVQVQVKETPLMKKAKAFEVYDGAKQKAK